MALTHVSASQIKNFEPCQRLWFYNSVLKIRSPTTLPQSKGTTIHGALEAYLKNGAVEDEIQKSASNLGLTPQDLDSFIDAIKPFVGKPGEGLTEHRDEIPTYPGGPKFVLVVDHAREIVVPNIGTIPQIDDLKTTSDFRYCKTPEELRKDVQMVSYARWALLTAEKKGLPEPGFVSIRHVYVKTRGKRVGTARDALMTPAEIYEQWERVLTLIREMELVFEKHEEQAKTLKAEYALSNKIPTIDFLPASVVDHCSAYGGCFFKPQCFGASVSGTFTMKSIFNQENKENKAMSDEPRKSLKQRIEEKKLLAAGGAVAPVAGYAVPPTEGVRMIHPPPHPSSPFAATPAPVAPPTQAAPSAAPVAPPSQATTCGESHALVPNSRCELPKHTGSHQSTNADGGVFSWNTNTVALGPSTDWKAITAPAPVAPAAPPVAAAPVAAPSAPVAEVLPPDAPARTTTPEEVKAANAPKKGRPKKITPAAPSAESVAITAPATQSAAPPKAAPASGPCTLKNLWIDCMPVKGGGEFTMAEEILQPVAEQAAEEAGVPDYRFISYNSKPTLATILRQHLAELPESIVVMSSQPGADVLIDVLAPHAVQVVRALRG